MFNYDFLITDNEDPKILNVPADKIENIQFGQTSGQVVWIAPTATDNSGVVTLDATLDSPQTLNIGTHTVQYTARDPAGRTATDSFTITVQGKYLRLAKYSYMLIRNSSGVRWLIYMRLDTSK